MRTIDIETAREFQQRGIPFINVLAQEQHQRKHIAGSDNVPLGSLDFAAKVEQLTGSGDEPVVVYCANPACDASPSAAHQLEDAGFKEVMDFEGGIEAWESAGLPLAGSAVD